MKKTIFDDDTLRKIYTLDSLEFFERVVFTSFVDDCIVVADVVVVVVVVVVVSMAAASFCCLLAADVSPEPGGCDDDCCCWFSGDAVSAVTIIAIFELF